MIARDDSVTRDAADPLAPLRRQFALDDADARGLIYLDGNSLGPLPRSTVPRVAGVVEDEWGRGLIGSWNAAGWIDLPRRVGDRLARLIGAAPGDVAVADSTSVNLFKALAAAIHLAAARGPSRVVLTEAANFPTDSYIADAVVHAHGFELIAVEREQLAGRLTALRPAVLMLTHVDYRTGRLHPMADVTRAAHGAGALVVWDLAHSAGAVEVDLTGAGADFAVGCGYKYLNGGPGAPAFLWAHPNHLRTLDREAWRPPLAGWMGHADPFAFAPDYVPAPGARRFLCGTPPILSLAALECGVDTVLAAEPFGGIAALRAKSVRLTELFIALVEERCAGHDLTIVSPRAPAERGSQISLARGTGAYAIIQALIAHQVIGDFRAPDILRFGFAPLYIRYVDVWDAVDRLARILAHEEWRDPRFAVRRTVT